MNLDDVIRKIPDFPKPGILFYDITSVFGNPDAYAYVIEKMLSQYDDSKIDGVIAIESRGFLLGSCYALRRQLPLILARKKGKLPGKTWQKAYALEYGEEILEIHKSDIKAGEQYLIVDDLIATGGTLEAVASMIEEAGAAVGGIFGIIGLPFLNYKQKIGKYNPITLINYDSE